MGEYKKEYGAGYVKKNMGKWLVIYLVAAIIIYGLVYALVIKKKSGGYVGTNQAESLYK